MFVHLQLLLRFRVPSFPSPIFVDRCFMPGPFHVLLPCENVNASSKKPFYHVSINVVRRSAKNGRVSTLLRAIHPNLIVSL